MPHVNCHLHKFLIGLATAAIISAGCASKPDSPTSNPTPATAPSVAFPQSWFEATDPLHVAGPIYYVGTKSLSVYLITTPAGHILLGGAMPESAPLIEASIRKLGYQPRDIKILLNNHAHIDHAGTLAELKKITGAKLAVMAGGEELLASGGKTDYLYPNDPRMQFPPVVVDRVLKDGEVIELGGVKITAYRTAGHTRGSTTFVMTIEESGRSYNVVFADGTSVNPGTRLVNHPSYPGILEDYRQTIAKLESLKPDIFLAYHAADFSFDEKRARAVSEGAGAFVDPEGYMRFVAERKTRIERHAALERANSGS